MTIRQLAADQGWSIAGNPFIRDVLRNELLWWQAYSLLEPFGNLHAETAKIRSTIATCATGEYFGPERFMPQLHPIVDPDDPEQIAKDEAAIDRLFVALDQMEAQSHT